MATLSTDVTAALASLRTRWGDVAPRVGGSAVGGTGIDGSGAVVGALATVPLPAEPADPERSPDRAPDRDRVVPTGFAALDAILGSGGVPRSTALAVRGSGSSGKTTLALRLAAEAQASGSIVAYVDLARSLDPVEAVARGVRLEWLVVLEPASIDEALAMAGALVGGRSVDLLIVDLPAERTGPRGALSGSRTRRRALAGPPHWTAIAVGRGPDRPAGGAGATSRRAPRRPGAPGPAGSGLERDRRIGRPASRARPTVVDPARPGRGRPANGGGRRAQPGRPAGEAGGAPDPLRGGWRSRCLPRPRVAPHRRPHHPPAMD